MGGLGSNGGLWRARRSWGERGNPGTVEVMGHKGTLGGPGVMGGWGEMEGKGGHKESQVRRSCRGLGGNGGPWGLWGLRDYRNPRELGGVWGIMERSGGSQRGNEGALGNSGLTPDPLGFRGFLVGLGSYFWGSRGRVGGSGLCLGVLGPYWVLTPACPPRWCTSMPTTSQPWGPTTSARQALG